MSGFHGQFVWCELMTDDLEAATVFYQAAIGWSARDAGLPDRRYTILGDAMGVAGAMELAAASRAAGARPGWTGYIAVDDLDAAVSRITAAGGALHRAPEEIPGIGRFAVLGDPQGPTFSLLAPLPGQQGSPASAPRGTPGQVGWHELHARDQDAAFAFYADLFHWTRGEAIGMGPMGTYQMFAAGGPDIGGMMTRSEDDPVRGWLHYFNVEAIEPAAERVQAAGGRIVNGPMQVPGGSWIAHALDPQGVMFAMVAPNHAASAA